MSKSVIYSTHISVTLDFIRQVPGYDITNPSQLRAVLRLIGFKVEDAAGKPINVEMLNNVNVRCKDKPYMFRYTTVFIGSMREDFIFPGLYSNSDILDITLTDDLKAELVNSLDYDIPVVEKTNTRKYTKRKDAPEFLGTEPELFEEVQPEGVDSLVKLFNE